MVDVIILYTLCQYIKLDRTEVYLPKTVFEFIFEKSIVSRLNFNIIRGLICGSQRPPPSEILIELTNKMKISQYFCQRHFFKHQVRN